MVEIWRRRLHEVGWMSPLVRIGLPRQGTIRTVVDMTRPSTVSTAELKVFLPLHLRPINPVVFRGSLAYASNINLEGGFLLRCFQRLSLRHLATLRWHERANRRTRGGSFQVLSY